MIALWATGPAWAITPAAVRGPLGDRGIAVEVSTTTASAAVALGRGRAIAIGFDPGAWLGATVGLGGTLIGADRAWGIDAGGSAGLAALIATPGVGIAASGFVAGGIRGEDARATFGIVADLRFRPIPPLQAAVPLALEPRAAVRLGRWWLGARGSVGPVFVPGSPPALAAEAGLTVRTER